MAAATGWTCRLRKCPDKSLARLGSEPPRSRLALALPVHQIRHTCLAPSAVGASGGIFRVPHGGAEAACHRRTEARGSLVVSFYLPKSRLLPLLGVLQSSETLEKVGQSQVQVSESTVGWHVGGCQSMRNPFQKEDSCWHCERGTGLRWLFVSP